MEIEAAAAVVFGEASGLGEATVRRLAAAGASVTLAEITGERAQLRLDAAIRMAPR